MIILLRIIKISVAILAFLNGLICMSKPNIALKLQQKFYEKINWRIEPINLNKELRNTRIMGFISLILAIVIICLTK